MGSHCTRAEAPHDRCWQAHKGLTFNALRGWERDHFDRLVHLAYGLRPASEVTESLGRVVRVHSALWMCIIPARSMGAQAVVCDLVAWAQTGWWRLGRR